MKNSHLFNTIFFSYNKLTSNKKLKINIQMKINNIISQK